ncbi:hypothetical protein EI42_04149 [Thermosporothrix hazakensis]|uniref:BACON domain-containing protein n=1 Tax=Thermosporothrix hazakensis TaxID=644383 RepID=A0A326U653_THEHA|nr:hypothetical protein [Thermosporothrix hazakensis]PZW25656.1 hypothetical protein EI42_04149 [Thermosporothrix hazakensis]GCE48151.1 hypothetical protein KTH_30200 [Thermosporothrix hazakensis]
MMGTYCPHCANEISAVMGRCLVCGSEIEKVERQKEAFVLEEAPTLHLDDIASLADLAEVPTEIIARPGAEETSAGKRRITAYLADDPLLPDTNIDISAIGGTWHKEVKPSPNRAQATYPPRPTSAPFEKGPFRPHWYQHFRPGLFAWISFVLMIMLVLGGAFGIFIALGQGTANTSDPGGLTLQITPGRVAVGATITLRGTRFTPNGRIALSRDTHIPLVDTSGESTIQADAQGNFTDTVVITSDWKGGTHVVNAEDAQTHKMATFPVIVSGKGSSAGPAHLNLSVDTLDMGAEDALTNTTRTISLLNTGGGQITWKGQSKQKWLLVSPSSGMFASGQSARITIAVDRSELEAGKYQGELTFTSNAGTVVLPVKMEVLPVATTNSGKMELSPVLLSFSATDGGPSPAPQQITLSNAGLSAFSWTAHSDANWLSVSPQTRTLYSGESMSLKVAVNTTTLLPGTYHGTIRFIAAENLPGSPQILNVTVTVLPRCNLEINPALLSFDSILYEDAPAKQTLTLGGSTGCSAPLDWKISSSAKWLTFDRASGSTKDYKTVGIGVNTKGMQPGTYEGELLFHTAAGTRAVPVTLTIRLGSTPAMEVSPQQIAVSAIWGAGNTETVPLTITNTGGGVLHWNASASSGVWMTLSQTSGTLEAGQSISIRVSASTSAIEQPGTYEDSITITATDQAGKAIKDAMTVPVSFEVQAPCSITATPSTIAFEQGANGSTTLTLTLSEAGSCANPLRWTAQASGKWLSVTPSSGQLSPDAAAVLNVTASSTGLDAGTYQGNILLSAVDSVTEMPVGTALNVAVSLNVQALCTLQAPQPGSLSFLINQGSNVEPRMLSIALSSGCNSVTVNSHVTPEVNWLSVSPEQVQATESGAFFTVSFTTATLPPGTYTTTLLLQGAGGEQQVPVVLVVVALPTPTITLPSPTLL